MDIAESRGNDGAAYPDGRDSVGSTLHWGPIPTVDAFWKTTGKHNIRRTDYSEDFHTFGLEWSGDYLFTYIDTRLLVGGRNGMSMSANSQQQTLFVKWNRYKTMWDRGQFGSSIVNKSALFDPWSQTGRADTPFDQPFYLILNLAVGGTNGYFKDGIGNKPWGDLSLTAPGEFWGAEDIWKATWGSGPARGMTVKSVKMWRMGKC
jgi:hypothetical protein